MDADLSDYFGQIPHAELMRSIARRVSDGRLLGWVKAWLEMAVEEDDGRGGRRRTNRARRERKGTPQGAPISPLFSNICMRRFILGWKVSRNGRIVALRSFLIRPPTAHFSFSEIHGLRWEDVRDAPTFGELWPTLRAWIDDAKFVAAHNASFDSDVLRACCATSGVRVPRLRFICTVRLARAQWEIYPTALLDVCRHLRIPLRHHDARSDAEACARIVLAAKAEGWHSLRPSNRRSGMVPERRGHFSSRASRS